MKRLYTLVAAVFLTTLFASAQVTTERCFHLDKVVFLQQKQDFWRSHVLYSTMARPMSMLTGGYYNLTEFNYGWGLAEKDVAFSNHIAGVSMVNGWRLGSGLAAGLGVGYYNYGDEWLLPVYGDFRYYFGKQKNKFFVMLAGGMLMSTEDFKEYTRFFANPGGGITVPLAKNMHLSFAAGLLTQYVTDLDRRDSFINMKLGLLFGK